MCKSKSLTLLIGVMIFSSGSLSADSVHPNGCKGVDLCTNNPIIDNCGWSVDVGLIYEQMRASNTDIGYHETNDGSATIEDPKHHHFMKNITFNMDPGLRIGLGYDFDFDHWQLKADFEWMYSTGRFVDTIDTGYYYPTHISFVYNVGNSSALPVKYLTVNSSLRVAYYLLDVYLHRGSYLSGRFSYEPFAGIKASWINYKLSRRFLNGEDTAVLPANTSWLNVGFDDFWGIGPMVGMNSNYHVCGGWSVFSSGNFSVLLGETYVKDYWGFVTTGVLPHSFLGLTTVVVISPTIRTILGVEYGENMFCDTQHLSFRAGFDTRIYFNQRPMFNRVASSLGNGNVTNDLVPTYFNNAYELIENGMWGMVGLLLEVGYEF